MHCGNLSRQQHYHHDEWEHLTYLKKYWHPPRDEVPTKSTCELLAAYRGYMTTDIRGNHKKQSQNQECSEMLDEARMVKRRVDALGQGF